MIGHYTTGLRRVLPVARTIGFLSGPARHRDTYHSADREATAPGVVSDLQAGQASAPGLGPVWFITRYLVLCVPNGPMSQDNDTHLSDE